MELRVDYDAVAHQYDLRTAEGALEGIGKALCSLAERVKATRILDLGCGTGRSLSLITRSHRARFFGLDLSMGMLLKARQFDPPITW